MKNYLSSWNFMRALRLALGIFVIVTGIQEQQWLLAIMGGLFSLMPILNIGCGPAGCNTPFTKSNKTMEEVSYEEIK